MRIWMRRTDISERTDKTYIDYDEIILQGDKGVVIE